MFYDSYEDVIAVDNDDDARNIFYSIYGADKEVTVNRAERISDGGTSVPEN